VPALLRMGFASALAYRAEFLVWLFAYTTPLIMMALWTAVAREHPIAGFDARAFQAYFIVTLVVRVSTGSWVVWEMNFDIRQGTLARKLLRPVHALAVYACENVAALPVRLSLTVPIFIAALAWLGPGILTHDPVEAAIVPLTLAGAWAIMFGWMALVGVLAMWTESSLKIFDAWLGLSFLLSGYLMPLDLFPDRVRAVIDWLPFRYMISFPVNNVLGRVDRAHALAGLGAQWVHVALVMLLLHLAWKRGLKRFQAYGG
jgi:ABC-2 type transport system permease protein